MHRHTDILQKFDTLKYRLTMIFYTAKQNIKLYLHLSSIAEAF